MKSKIVASFLLCWFLIVPSHIFANSWQEEFERLCGATEQTENLSVEQVKDLINDCDKLLKVVQEQGGKQKKVYLFRLTKCRNFFEYVVSLKESGKAKD